jgi:hypothetical protein
MEIDRLGKYELRAVLGRGAMGTVYDGWDPLIARRVAVKTVRLPAPEPCSGGRRSSRSRDPNRKRPAGGAPPSPSPRPSHGRKR